ncbi:MAG: acetate--CoA ligase family protein [Actinomycetota bacterium]
MSQAIANLWRAKSIAIIGASEREGAMSRLPISYLKKYGFKGEIFPVNPKGGEIAGITAYKSIKDIPKKIELALIMVPVDAAKTAVRECGEAGVSIVTVMGSGFAESGESGKELQDEIISIAKEFGMRVVGPNCIGSIGSEAKLLATFSPVFASDSTELAKSGLALVSQSGALGYGTYSLGIDRSLPIGIVVTTGNEADVTALEVAKTIADDESITGLLIYAESIDDLSALEYFAKAKPTAILKSGRSEAGARAAESHTGALATSDRVIDAAIKRAGAVRVNDVEELLDAGAIFATKKRLAGNRIAVITTSGGSGILAADAIERYGLQLAQLSKKTRDELDQIIPAYGSSANPVDLTAAVMADKELFKKAIQVLSQDPGIDAIVAALCVLVGDDVEMIANTLKSINFEAGEKLPIVIARTGSPSLAPSAVKLFIDANLPTFPVPERAVRALSILKDATKSKRETSSRTPITSAIPEPKSGVTEKELKELWRQSGISVPENVLIESSAGASEAVKSVGGRAVMKVVIPGVIHKTEIGGVLLDIDEKSAENSAAKLLSLSEDAKVMVERFIPKGVEALVGVTTSSIGKVLTVGVGGVLTEVIRDSALRILPVTKDDVEEMLNETRLGQLIEGVRGERPGNRSALVETILRITDATEEWQGDFELDVNPVTITAEGAWVLDSAYVRREN